MVKRSEEVEIAQARAVSDKYNGRCFTIDDLARVMCNGRKAVDSCRKRLRLEVAEDGALRDLAASGKLRPTRPSNGTPSSFPGLNFAPISPSEPEPSETPPSEQVQTDLTALDDYAPVKSEEGEDVPAKMPAGEFAKIKLRAIEVARMDCPDESKTAILGIFNSYMKLVCEHIATRLDSRVMVRTSDKLVKTQAEKFEAEKQVYLTQNKKKKGDDEEDEE